MNLKQLIAEEVRKYLTENKLRESNIESVFPTTLTFTKELWNIGIRKDFGSLGKSKNYHYYEWTDKETEYDSNDFINRGVVMMLDPESVERNYAEYKPIGGSSRSIRGFTPDDIEAFRSLKAIKE
jgi:hypothetical protein